MSGRSTALVLNVSFSNQSEKPSSGWPPADDVHERSLARSRLNGDSETFLVDTGPGQLLHRLVARTNA